MGYSADLCTGGTPTGSSNYDGSMTPDKAVNNSASDYWVSASTPTPHWWKYDFGSGVSHVVTQYTIQVMPGGQNPPRQWVFEGSNDDSNWTALDTKNTDVNFNAGERKVFPFTNTTAYRYVRLRVTYAPSGYAALSEFEVMKDTVVTLCTSDHRYYIDNNFDWTANNSRIGNDGAARGDCFIFENVAIPAGATITSAVFNMQAGGARAEDTCKVKIHGDDVDDAVVPANAAGAKAEPLTTAYVSWTIGHWVDQGMYATPDLSTVIQEIIDRAGWASGNNIQLFLNDDGSDENARRHCTADYDINNLNLTITYEETPPEPVESDIPLTELEITVHNPTVSGMATNSIPLTALEITPHNPTNLAMSADICNGGTVIYSNQYSIYYASYAFDNNTGTSWLSQSSIPYWIGYDLGVGNAKIPVKYRLRSGPYGNYWQHWDFQGSNDGENWTTIHSITSAWSYGSNAWHDFTAFICSTAYRYFRFYIGDNAPYGAVDISEIEIMENVLGGEPAVSTDIPCMSLAITIYAPESVQPPRVPLTSLLITVYTPHGFIPIATPDTIALEITVHQPHSTGKTIAGSAALALTLYAPTISEGGLSSIIPLLPLTFALKNPSVVWELAAALRPSAQVIYYCILTGANESPVLDELYIPISSFQSRIRNGEPSYLSCVIPNPDDYVDEIAARANGEIIIQKGFRLVDGSVNMAEIIRVDYETLALDLGGRSASGTIVGHKTVTATAPKEWTVEGVSFYGLQHDGKRRLRAAMDLFLRPGDVAIYGSGDDDSFIVGQITYIVNTLDGLMEVTEA